MHAEGKKGFKGKKPRVSFPWDSGSEWGNRRATECEAVDSRGIGTFVGRFGDQVYQLGSMVSALARAIRRVSELRREMEAEAA